MHATPSFWMAGQAWPPQATGPDSTNAPQAEAGWRAVWPHGLQALMQTTAGMCGGFAVALQCAQTGRAFLAVDRFAAQTLCYRVHEGRLQVASSADELAGRGEALSAQALFNYLYFHCIPSPGTVFEGVMRLPPAHCVWFDQGQLTVQPYWTPSFQPQRTASFDNLKAEFLQVLQQSVQRSMGPGTPACFLSGGTDSSTVAGMVRELTGQGAEAFSIGFEAEGYDEMDYARLAARHFGARHHEYYVTPDDLVRSISDVAGSFDQPFGNSSVLPTYYCALQARQAGVQHLLAGDGGDELYGGNVRYAKQRVFDHYGRVPAPMRSGLLEPMFLSGWARQVPGVKKVSSYIEQARVPMPDRLQMYNLLQRLGVQEVLEPGFLSQVDTAHPGHHQRAVWRWAGSGDAAQPPSELNRTLAYDWRYTLAESDVPKVRGATALAGVTVGYPMLDKALLEFSLTLPDDYKLNGQKLRWFFKEALRGFLPDEIINKPKHGFGLPFGPWMLRHAKLKALATDSLHTLSARGLVKPAFIRQLLDQRLAEHPGYYGEMIWILMMLEQWLRQHRPQWQA